MVTYCNNIFQNEIRFSYYNNTFRCNKVILATILIDVINLSYYYNKRQPIDAIVYIYIYIYITSIIFVVAILLVVTCLFSYSVLELTTNKNEIKKLFLSN